jgi:hypothetical protein
VNNSYPANLYDGLTSKPLDARVGLREPGSLEVEVNGERSYWPLEHAAMQWERTNTTLRITFGEHPRKVLITRDKLFIATFVKRMQYAGRRGVYDRTLSLARQGPALFFLALVAVVVVGYIWVLPFTAERLALLLPLEVDERLGQAAYGSVTLGMDEDTARSAVLQRFGDRLDLSDRFELRFPLCHKRSGQRVRAARRPHRGVHRHPGKDGTRPMSWRRCSPTRPPTCRTPQHPHDGPTAWQGISSSRCSSAM